MDPPVRAQASGELNVRVEHEIAVRRHGRVIRADADAGEVGEVEGSAVVRRRAHRIRASTRESPHHIPFEKPPRAFVQEEDCAIRPDDQGDDIFARGGVVGARRNRRAGAW